MKKTAFTLVELIVVITILAILATVWFVSFSGYLAWARDTNRIAQLKSMSDALELYRTKKDLPIPDDKVDVQANGTTIAYQWYIWANVLETIEYTEKGLDPKDKNYFTYYLTKDKKEYQLLWFLEETNEDVLASNNIIATTQAIDYSERIPKSQWKKLGVLTDSDNTPIQDVSTITSNWFLDLVTTTEEYNAIFSDTSILTGTWKTLRSWVSGWWLVWYWSFDEIVDNSFVDYSENEAVWTISWWVSVSAWQVWNAADFDWVDGSFIVDLIENIWWNSAAPHTISAWIKPTSIPVCDSYGCRQWILLLWKSDLLDLWTTWPWTHHWLIWWKDWPVQFWIWNWEQKNPSLYANIWQHVTLVFDWSDLKSYVNGVLSTKKSSETNRTDMNIKDSILRLWNIAWGTSTKYNWSMDELKIYNRALSKKEVELLYEIDK